MVEKPRWLEDEPEIVGLLNTFIDKLDRKPAEEWKVFPELKVTAAKFPELFRMNDEAYRSWALIKSLKELDCITIVPSAKRTKLDPEWKDARLVLNVDFEIALRQWLQRPRKPSLLAGWQAVVGQCAHHFPGDVSLLQARPITVPGRSSSEVVAGFIAIAQFQSQRLALTQLSACCFWGQSKFLEGREELVAALYPGLELTPRPLIINVYLPEVIEGVLLIENQDSYCSAVSGRPLAARNMALVYCAGFRGSAQRIRNREGVSFYYQGDCTRQREFESWWFGDAWRAPELHFWGDLDFSGMAILKGLRQRFDLIEPWRPGYEPMLQQLLAGNGHTPEQANKEEQGDPVVTGCNYADNTLLPALRAVGLFVDQEAVF